MANLSRTQLLELLEEQLSFIEKSISDYQVNEIEAKRVATNIRVLVHDTGNSNSLLNQLNAKGIGFIDTNAPKGGMAYWYLDSVGMNGGKLDQNTPYIGIVGKELIGKPEGLTIQYFPAFLKWSNYISKIDFNSWWNAEIYDNRKGYTLTRKQLKLNVVNKDCGAHIDVLGPEYASFKNNENIKLMVDGKLQGFDNIPVYSAVMQIAWELLESIKVKIENIRK